MTGKRGHYNRKWILFLGLMLTTTIFMVGVVHHSGLRFGELKKIRDELSLTNFSGLTNTEEMRQRMSDLDMFCSSSSKFPKSIKELTPTQKNSFLRYVFVNAEYKFLYCFVPKVSCSNWKRVLMKLQNIEDPNNKKVAQAIPPGLKVLSSYTKEKIDSMMKNYYKFMIVRHPLERVVSAYRDKFENDQIYDKGIPKNIKKKYRGAGNEKNGPEVITPEEFVRYLIDQEPIEAMDDHWRPMYSICQPCLMNYDTIGSLDHTIEDSEDILRKFKAPPNVHFPDRGVNYAKPTSMNVTISFFSQVNEKYIQQLIGKYSNDYDLFSFPRPDLKFFRVNQKS